LVTKITITWLTLADRLHYTDDKGTTPTSVTTFMVALKGLKETEIQNHGFKFKVYWKKAEDDEGYLVCHHGIGSSAHTFALFTEKLMEANPKLGIITFDVRHHGYTDSLASGGEGQITDLDPATLENDLQMILLNILPQDTPVSLLLLGHSMGGTIMARFANNKTKPANYDIRGLIVVDAVEGYARQSLSSMHSLLSMWPQHFRSYDEAIKWHVERGHLLRNRESAKISVPPLLVQNPKTDLLDWKLVLSRTESNWDKWFENLDELFLQSPSARLLILAGVGRLDTSLTRGQMQGKFQLMLVRESGHFIHEDVPEKVAAAVNDFWSRNGKPIKIVPKFGQIRS